MRSINPTNGRGSPSAPDTQDRDLCCMILDLEALPCGRSFSARDGSRFIRTNLICFGFCELATGQLCSARDICARHGGVGATTILPQLSTQGETLGAQAATGRHGR